jgi:hypothetical protein
MATLMYSSKDYSRENILSLTPNFEIKYAAMKLIDAICISSKESKSANRQLSYNNGKLFTPENKFVRFKG